MAGLTALGVVLLGAGGPWPFWGTAAIVAGVQLSTAARSTVHRSIWQRLSRSVPVSEAAGPIPLTIGAGALLDDVIERLLAEGVDRTLLVVGPNGDPAGIIRAANLRGVRRAEWGERAASTVMTPLAALPRLAGDLSVFDAVTLMDERNHHVALVETGDRLVPVTRDHLIRRLIERRDPRATTMNQG
jgi:CBS domain-containing protein